MSFFLLRLRLFLSDLPITLGLKKSPATLAGEVPDSVVIDTLRLRHHSSGCGATGVVGYTGSIERLNLGARFFDKEDSVVSENSISLLASEGSVANFSITSPSFEVTRVEVYWRGFGDLNPIAPSTEQADDANPIPL